MGRDDSAHDLLIALGRVIQARRSRMGHTQESLADVADLHRTFVGAIERGERNVTFRNLVALADALHIPVSTLIGAAEAEMSVKQSG